MTKELLDHILTKEIIGPIITVCASILLYGILKRIISKMFHLNFGGVDVKKNKTIAGIVTNILKYLIIVIDILIILSLFGVDTKGIIASLGIVGVVVGLAVQDTLKDFFSGIFILTEDQYRVGDTVTIGDFKGEVISLGLKTTRVRAYTGEIKIISNRNINELINHSKANSLAIVDVATEYHEDTNKIETTLEDLCQKLSNELPNLRGKLQSLGIVDLGDDAVVFRVTVETKPMMHYEVERLIRKAIKEEFKKQKINIPFRQLVIHNG